MANTKQTAKKNTRKKANSPKSQSRSPQKNEEHLQLYKVRYELKVIALIAVTLFSILSLYTTAVGVIGGSVKQVLLGVFSHVGYIVPIIIFGYVFVNLNPNFKPARKRFYWGASLIVFCMIMINGLLVDNAGDFSKVKNIDYEAFKIVFEQSATLQSGGILGELLSYLLVNLVGETGAYLFAFVTLIVGFIVLTRISLQDLWEHKKQQLSIKKIDKKNVKEAFETYVMDKKTAREPSKTSYLDPDQNFLSSIDMRRRDKNKKNISTFDYDSYEQPLVSQAEQPVVKPTSVINTEVTVKPQSVNKEPLLNEDQITEYSPAHTIDFTTHDIINTKKEKPIDKVKQSDIDETTQKVVVEEISKNVNSSVENYIMPPIELLKDMPISQNTEDKSEYLEMAKRLEETLFNFGVDAKVLSVKKGPAITMFEIQPSPGIKVSKIVGLSDDIALNLATSHVRIAPIPGKAAIGIEVPNKSTSMVTLREVIGMDEFKNHGSKLAIGLGKDISGNPIIGDLASMPHLLIAGATGSGKSVCVNTIVSSILYNAKPDEVKFLMIDPKVVELSNYNGIPHLILPVVTDPKKASIALNWAVNEMTRRYKLFAESSVRDMKSYNKKAILNGLEKLAQIVVIIDELADLMMVAPNQVEDAICRLAQMARAAGIHLIVATQRPSVDVITGLIKANIPSRIAFSVSSSIDSRTIIDMGGAEKLLGKGDMLYYPVGAAKPKRAQGAFMSDEEVEALVHFIKNQAVEVKYNEDILEEVQAVPFNDEEQMDEHLEDAIAFVVETGQASASLLQRRFRVGYNRAARLIDSMEERAIIGPARGSKPREVLMTSHALKALDGGQIDMFDEEMEPIIEE